MPLEEIASIAGVSVAEVASIEEALGFASELSWHQSFAFPAKDVCEVEVLKIDLSLGGTARGSTEVSFYICSTSELERSFFQLRIVFPIFF